MEKLVVNPVSEIEAGREISPLMKLKAGVSIRKFNRGAKTLKATKARPASVNQNK